MNSGCLRGDYTIILLLYSCPACKTPKIIFQLIVTDKVDLDSIYSTCVVYTKTIIIITIHVSVGESGG